MPLTPDSKLPERDDTYYIFDGNITLLVDNTFFKVHRSMLIKDKSTFDSMFSLDLDNHAGSSTMSEGQCDDNPIRLQGDSAHEFRALLWALYSLPHELMMALTPEADPLLLLNLSRITHKYHFHSIESWALGALTTLYKQPSPPTTDLPTLIRTTELAVLCDQDELLEILISRWKRLIGEPMDLAIALGVAERLNLRSLLGLAYYAMMLKGREHWEAEPQLTRAHRIRLLSGHYNLGRVCEKLPSMPPVLEHDCECTGAAQRRCEKSWAVLWRAITENMCDQLLSLQHADVIWRVMLTETVLRALVKHEIPSEGLLDALGVECGKNALVATGEKLKELQNSLVDFFADVE